MWITYAISLDTILYVCYTTYIRLNCTTRYYTSHDLPTRRSRDNPSGADNLSNERMLSIPKRRNMHNLIYLSSMKTNIKKIAQYAIIAILWIALIISLFKINHLAWDKLQAERELEKTKQDTFSWSIESYNQTIKNASTRLTALEKKKEEIEWKISDEEEIIAWAQDKIKIIKEAQSIFLSDKKIISWQQTNTSSLDVKAGK